MDELYDTSIKSVHLTVTEDKQWIDVVTTEGETILAATATAAKPMFFYG
jgi:hypothetical protein